MIEIHTPGIDVDKLKACIRKQLQQRKPLAPLEHKNSNTPKYSNKIYPFMNDEKKFFTSAVNPLPFKERYTLKEFLGFHGSDFIDRAYCAILHRSPDVSGRKHYLDRLQKGELTKSEILGHLRYSREGRNKKILVKGLLFPFLFQKILKLPVLGWGMQIFTGLINFPTLLKNMRTLECTVFTQNRFVMEQTEMTAADLSALRKEISQFQQAQKSEMIEGLAGLQKEIAEVQIAQKTMITEGFAELSENKADKNELLEIIKQIKDHKLNIIDMQRRLQILLEEARKRFPEPISAEQIENLIKEEDHLYDAIYVSFEDRFRGTRQDIKQRQSVYLPYVKNALKASKGGLVFDLGCGRGEWLEFLKENDIKATGLDLNRMMVDQCLKIGLDVIQSEAIQYLRSLKNNSISVISGFHLIEHLRLNTMIALFDESLRVLKPGGMVIFETPNPENLLVGACRFYTDPTHKNPIPPITLEFLIESRGFVNNTILRLHPLKEVSHINDRAMQDVNDLLDAVGKAQDYAVMGYKA